MSYATSPEPSALSRAIPRRQVGEGRRDRGGAGLDAERLEDRLDVAGDGVRADRQDCRDLGVGLALREPRQDLRLASREPEGLERTWCDPGQSLSQHQEVV